VCSIHFTCFKASFYEGVWPVSVYYMACGMKAVGCRRFETTYAQSSRRNNRYNWLVWHTFTLRIHIFFLIFYILKLWFSGFCYRIVSLMDIGVLKERTASVFKVEDCRAINCSHISERNPKNTQAYLWCFFGHATFMKLTNTRF
jgi:hypothetical protein